MRAAIAAVVALGCGAVPAEPPSIPAGATEVAAPVRAGEAIAVVLHAYEAELGIALPSVTVHWTTTPMAYGDGFVPGLCFGCDNIWVMVRSDRPGTFRYSLPHEIGHCARLMTTGDLDPGHTDALWWKQDGLVDQAELAMHNAGM